MKINDVIKKELKGLWGAEASENSINTPVIKTNNMTYEGVINYSDITYRNIDPSKIRDNKLQKGDLLIEKSGGTKTHSVGYVNYFDGENNKYVCNNFILALRPDKDVINSKYLFYLMKFYYESGIFGDCYNKTTGIQNLKKDAYLGKEIKTRELDKQDEIVNVLDNITKAISVKRTKILSFDELIKSRFMCQEVVA